MPAASLPAQHFRQPLCSTGSVPEAVSLRQLGELRGPELLRTGCKRWRPKIPPPHPPHLRQPRALVQQPGTPRRPISWQAVARTEHMLWMCRSFLSGSVQIECMAGLDLTWTAFPPPRCAASPMCRHWPRALGAAQAKCEQSVAQSVVRRRCLAALLPRPWPLPAVGVANLRVCSALLCSALFFTSLLCSCAASWVLA